jgi:hypothetical protein
VRVFGAGSELEQFPVFKHLSLAAGKPGRWAGDIAIRKKKMDVRYCIDLIKAALQNVEAGYFNLITTYEPSGIVRERVFCYELYHQIRTLMTDDFSISLNGEIDKRGHVDFEKEHRKNPDFVFHTPGTHIGNTIVIEVKGRLDYPDSEILGDFETLLTFVSRYWYESGIFILYNHSCTDLLDIYGEDLQRLKSRPKAECIYIVTIDSPHAEPEEIILAEIPGQVSL